MTEPIEQNGVIEQPIEQTGVIEPVEQPGQESWYSGEEYKDVASKYDTQDAMLKEFTNAQSLIGKKGIIKPGDDATPEQVSEYYTSLGRPTEADKYEFEVADDAPDWAGESSAMFKDMAFDSGLSQEQAQKVFSSYVETQNALNEKIHAETVQAREDCIAELKSAYGGDADRMIALSSKVASEAGIVGELAISSLANDPKMVSLLADYAKLKGISSSAPTVESTVSTGSTIGDQISAIRANKAYGSDTTEGRQLNETLNQLYVRKSKGFA